MTTHVHCCDPSPPLPDHADLADTFCFLRAHPHLTKRRSCKASRDEATAVVDCLRLLIDVRESVETEWPAVDCAFPSLHDHRVTGGFVGPWDGPHTAQSAQHELMLLRGEPTP